MKAITAVIALAAGAGVYYFATKAKASQTVVKNGREWILEKVSTPPRDDGKVITGQGETWNVYAPAGSWGPHGKLLVVQYHTVLGPGSGYRVLSGVGQDVPVALRDAAIAAFDITVPGT